MLRILNSCYLMETSVAAYRLTNYSRPGNLRLVVDVIYRLSSREDNRFSKSVLAYRLTKIVSFSPDERLFYKIVPILTVDYTGTWIRILKNSIIGLLDSHDHFIVNYDPILL